MKDKMMISEMKPRLHLSDKDLRAIKGWKVGSSYKLLLDVKQVGMNESDYGEKRLSADFEIIKAREVKDAPENYSPEVVKKAKDLQS